MRATAFDLIFDKAVAEWGRGIPTIHHPAEAHAAFCFHLFYKKPYLEEKKLQVQLSSHSDDEIDEFEKRETKMKVKNKNDDFVPRAHHGISHVSRVALYTSAFYNLYREIDKTISISEEDRNLLILAALFHDSAREGDETDYWDLESAEMLFRYLVKIGVGKEKAIQFAEVIGNKDLATKDEKPNYNKLTVDSDGNVSWSKIGPIAEKSILMKLLHDADSLDIIRARDQYFPEYLDCYSLLEKGQYSLLNDFIIEARKLISQHGEARKQGDGELQKRLCHDRFYGDMLEAVQKSDAFFTIRDLVKGVTGTSNRTFISDKNDPGYLSEKNLAVAIREGKLFFRGVSIPRAHTRKSIEKSKTRPDRTPESSAACEIYKACRRPGVPTRSVDERARVLKDGNPNRSLSLLIGRGTGTFTNVGFGVLDPEKKQIAKVAKSDADTGYGSKKHFSDVALSPMHEEEIARQIASYIDGAETGRLSLYHGSDVFYSEAVFYKLWETDYNLIVYERNDKGGGSNNDTSYLDAVYMQQLFKKQTGIELPIFEYNGNESSLYARKSSDNEIYEYWKIAIEEAFQKLTKTDALKILLENTRSDHLIENLKSIIFPHYVGNSFDPMDLYYSVGLKDDIKKLLEEKYKVIENQIVALFRSFSVKEDFFRIMNCSLRRIQRSNRDAIALNFSPYNLSELLCKILKSDGAAIPNFLAGVPYALEKLSGEFMATVNDYYSHFNYSKNVFDAKFFTFLILMSQKLKFTEGEELAKKIVRDFIHCLVELNAREMHCSAIKAHMVFYNIFSEYPDLVSEGDKKKFEKYLENQIYLRSKKNNSTRDDISLLIQIGKAKLDSHLIHKAIQNVFSSKNDEDRTSIEVDDIAAMMVHFDQFDSGEKVGFKKILLRADSIVELLGNQIIRDLFSDFSFFEKMFENEISKVGGEIRSAFHRGLGIKLAGNSMKRILKWVDYINSDQIQLSEEHRRLIVEKIEYFWREIIKTRDEHSIGDLAGLLSSRSPGGSQNEILAIPQFVYDQYFAYLMIQKEPFKQIEMQYFVPTLESATYSHSQWKELYEMVNRLMPAHKRILNTIQSRMAELEGGVLLDKVSHVHNASTAAAAATAASGSAASSAGLFSSVVPSSSVSSSLRSILQALIAIESEYKGTEKDKFHELIRECNNCTNDSECVDRINAFVDKFLGGIGSGELKAALCELSREVSKKEVLDEKFLKMLAVDKNAVRPPLPGTGMFS